MNPKYHNSKHQHPHIDDCADNAIAVMIEENSLSRVKFYFYSGIYPATVTVADLFQLISNNRIILTAYLSCIINHKFPKYVKTEDDKLDYFLRAICTRIEAL